MKKLALHWQVIIALILGGLFAWAAIKLDFTEFVMDWINPFGVIFVRLLKLVAVPLVLFSIIVGVASLGDIKKLGSIGGKTLLTYLLTTVFAVGIGLLVVNVWKPGARVDDNTRLEFRLDYELWKGETGAKQLDEDCFSCLPENAEVLAKVAEKREGQAVDEDVQKKLDIAAKTKNDGPLQPLVDVIPSNFFTALTEMEMLQIIFFAIFFGIMMLKLPKDKFDPVFKAMDGLNEIFVAMVWVIMRAMPYFVFALIAGQVVKVAGKDADKMADLFVFLLHYSGAVLLGLFFLIFIFYPNLVSTLVKKMSYKRFMSGMKSAQLTAFSTSSSVATLPVTMDCVENKIGVSERTTSFVLPIGATVNMDGTSLYQAVAVVAMAQLHMVDLGLGQQLIIVLTASLASIGAAAIPSAGLVLMILVLGSVGLDGAWIAIILPVDRILDMVRTVTNVTGDGAVSTIIANAEGELSDVDTTNNI